MKYHNITKYTAFQLLENGSYLTIAYLKLNLDNILLKYYICIAVPPQHDRSNLIQDIYVTQFN